MLHFFLCTFLKSWILKLRDFCRVGDVETMAAASDPEHGRDFPVTPRCADQGGTEVGRGAGDVSHQRPGGGWSVPSYLPF